DDIRDIQRSLVTVDATGTAVFRLYGFGSASIWIDPPAGFQSTAGTGGFHAAVNAVANGSTTLNAAFATRADLSGYVTEGQFSAPLVGWHVYLDLNHNGTLDGGERSQLTDETGGYFFKDVAPGTYDVRCILEDSALVPTTPLVETYTVI